MGTLVVMEEELCANASCHFGRSRNHTNGTLEALDTTGDVLMTTFLGCILGILCLIGMVGNIYILVVINLSIRLTGSMYVYIVNLALADLLYLCTIPFVLCTYLLKDWYFGELGCRVLFSLDLLTMHASIFILTVVSTERYLAVVKPFNTMRRPRNYRKIVACLVWLVSFLLALPTMILIDLKTTNQNGSTKRICHPTWQTEAYKIYLTVLFNTSILGPGLVIGYLYIQLAKTYWSSQVALFSVQEMKGCPRQKVLYMILIIILAYWTCFTPFWLWQLLSVYHHQLESLTNTTMFCINFFLTCLTYSNSCINPFLYTLLSKNYKEYLRNQKKNALLLLSRAQLQRVSSKNSTWSGSHTYTENVAIVQMEGISLKDVTSL